MPEGRGGNGLKAKGVPIGGMGVCVAGPDGRVGNGTGDVKYVDIPVGFIGVITLPEDPLNPIVDDPDAGGDLDANFDL